MSKNTDFYQFFTAGKDKGKFPAHAMKASMVGNRRTAPVVQNLGARWT
jgi:hypothetical protein